MLGGEERLVVDLASAVFCAMAFGANMPNADMITNAMDVILAWNDSGGCCIFGFLGRNRNGLLDRSKTGIVAMIANEISDFIKCVVKCNVFDRSVGHD